MKLGLIGHPVSHSLSPPMHRAALLFFGIDGSYDGFDIGSDDLFEGVAQLRSNGFAGFNVTIPHKESIYHLADHHSVEANVVGAINTVRFDSAGQMFGHNTDLEGFNRALRLALNRRSKSEASKEEMSKLGGLDIDSVIVLGAGGAARACIAALLLNGYKNLTVVARRIADAQQVCKSVSAAMAPLIQSQCNIQVISFDQLVSSKNFSLVVNCTPIGLTNLELPFWGEILFAKANKQALLFDTVYKRDSSPTLLMELAFLHGLQAVDGIRMLVEQAALSFEFWTGRRPPSDLMLDALRTACQKESGPT